MSEHVSIEDTAGGVRLIRLARPEKKNALTGAMYDTMRTSLEQADASGDVGAIVFAGAPGMFTAGNDISDFVAGAAKPFTEAPALRFIRQLARTKTPIVAAVDGIAVGIGTTLTLHCDLVYASPAARFRMPFVELGLVPEAASSYLLPRRVGLAQGDRVTAAVAALRCRRGPAARPPQRDRSERDAAGSRAGQSRDAGRPAARRASASRTLIRGDQAAVEAALEAEAVAFEARLRAPEAQAAFMSFLSRSRTAAS